MKLAVFTSKYPAKVATFFERDMAALRAAGVEIDVFCLYPVDDTLWPYCIELKGQPAVPRDHVYHLGALDALKQAWPILLKHPRTALKDAIRILFSSAQYGPVAFAKTLYALPKAWAWAARFADRYDHVLGYWGNYSATAAFVFHRLQDNSVPFSMWLHAGTDLYRSPIFMKQKLQYSDNIVTCCDFNFDYIREHFANGPRAIHSKVHVCHHGLDVSEFPFGTDGRATNRVIAVGRMVYQKGFDHLLRAISILRRRGVDVVVEMVGEGDQQGMLENLARELGISEHVTFRGHLPFPQARQAMREATLLVHSSGGLGDGLPNVIREAMALGTPVVATRVAGIPDALEKGCGVLVPPKDPEALADGIESLLRSPESRARIAVRARARVEERYDLWRNGAWLANLFTTTRRRAEYAAQPAIQMAPENR